MNIYIDIIAMENIIINYVILMMTAKFARTETNSLRLLLGSIAGTAYVILMILMPMTTALFSMTGKALLSFAIVAISFNLDSIKSFFRTLAVFYVTTFIFAGASFAFLYFNNSGGFIHNGVSYILYKSKWSTIMLSVATCMLILKVFWGIIRIRISKDRLLKHISIFFEDKHINIEALVDTGNMLYDPLSDLPVVIVEYSAIEQILPDEIKYLFCNGSIYGNLLNATSFITQSGWLRRFRLIPFSSLGKENGMLIGFKPDCLRIDDEYSEKSIKDVIICIYNKALSKNKNYRALLSAELI